MTLPEVLLWVRLRKRTSGAPVFRRQHPLGDYVLDFYCAEAALVIEVDGFVHRTGEAGGRDARRDAWLQDQGLLVVRLPAADVLADADAVADGLWRLALDRNARR